VRWDAGIVEGDTVAGAFDSMIAKLIVTGRTRKQALERSRRALAELEVDGMPTVVPFDRAIVDDPAFAPEGDAPFTIHTRWIETEFDNQVAPFAGEAAADGAEDAGERQRVTVEVGGRRLEVVLPAGLALGGGGSAAKKKAPKRSGGSKAGAAASGDSLTAPMQGTIVKVGVEEGQEVAEGDLVVVLEAMKMEQPITAHKSGTISALTAEVGATVTNGAVLCEIKDA
jgi:acetyl-CoA/propionyl-CoA carboxylase biotin carboxyl carrier protein